MLTRMAPGDTSRHHGSRVLRRSQRAQEIDDVLLLGRTEPVESIHYHIRLAALTPMRLDGLDQVTRAPIVQEVDALSDAP